MSGTVYLIGAGPGDPELLTVKAHRLITSARLVIYDRLVSAPIMELVPTDAEKIFVGKEPGRHLLPQEDINQLIIDRARRGQNVIRLKGGDPYIFGRGGEEALALLEAGISFDIVPGITSASGCAAYAGIPLTHRGLATGVRFITGHRRKGPEGSPPEFDLNWASIADPDTTLVFYMGLTYFNTIAQHLIAAGLPGDTPAAAIQDGTRPTQQRVIGTLSTLGGQIEKAGLLPPSLLIVGRVVSLADQLPELTA